MGERSFGARWWRESLGIARFTSRPALGTMGLLGALALPACATTWAGQEGAEYADSYDEININMDALQLQRDEGWDVGQWGTPLQFVGSTDVDAAGTQAWREAMANLAVTMAPSAPALQPFYVPTLFQSLIGPAGQRLRAVMRPMHTAELDDDVARGIALRVQFGTVDFPKDTALVIDAPGPRAVAVAAALADRFAPVFMFGNWPHPQGVVPAHQTIAAALYYLPMLSAAAAVRAPDAPPMFVLDANRLAPYRDGNNQFDNRYFVKLPSAEQLAALGVRHVLYVGADGGGELDDLNGAFVAMCGKGVDVKMLALSDFVRAGDEPQLAINDDGDEAEGDEGDAEAVAAADPAWTWMFAWVRPPWLWSHFWYRGCWWGYPFWGDYGWYHPHGVGHVVPHPRRGAIVVGPPTGTRMPPLGSHAAWSPKSRATLFTPAVGHAPAAAFGQVAVRAARADGHILGMGASPAAYGGGWGARAGGGGVGAASRTPFHGPGGGFSGRPLGSGFGARPAGGGFSSHPIGGSFGGGRSNATFHSAGAPRAATVGGFGGGRSGSIGRASASSFGGG
jgi:hypothetical protein